MVALPSDFDRISLSAVQKPRHMTFPRCPLTALYSCVKIASTIYCVKGLRAGFHNYGSLLAAFAILSKTVI